MLPFVIPSKLKSFVNLLLLSSAKNEMSLALSTSGKITSLISQSLLGSGNTAFTWLY